MVNIFLLLVHYISKLNIQFFLEIKLECHVGADSVDWFLFRVHYHNKFFGKIFKINIPPKEEIVTPMTTDCDYYKNCKKKTV